MPLDKREFLLAYSLVFANSDWNLVRMFLAEFMFLAESISQCLNRVALAARGNLVLDEMASLLYELHLPALSRIDMYDNSYQIKRDA